MKRWIIFCIFICLPYSVLSQGIWTYYTDELPGVVFDMTQDKYGNYWFATTNGVCELDTNGFWHYLTDTTVWDTTMYFKNQIVVDRDNNKWFVGLAMSNATKEYVVKYNDSTFTYYNPSGREKDSWITSLGIDSSGSIWAGSMSNWAYWFDGTFWHSVWVPGTSLYDPIRDFAVDKTGTFYIAHTNGISTINRYLWGDYYKSAGSLCFDLDNQLWFGTMGFGLGVYNGQSWKMYTTADGLLDNDTYVAIDSNYNIWVSYFDREKGVTEFNGQKWSHLNKEHGLIDDAVHRIFVDKYDKIWFAHTFKIGISVYFDTTTTNTKYRNKNIELLKEITLYQNFPNPFNAMTTINYELKQDEKVNLSIFNLKGEEVICLDFGEKEAGNQQFIWNGKNKYGKEVSSGIYIYVLKADNFIESKKMILIR